LPTASTGVGAGAGAAAAMGLLTMHTLRVGAVVTIGVALYGDVACGIGIGAGMRAGATVGAIGAWCRGVTAAAVDAAVVRLGTSLSLQDVAVVAVGSNIAIAGGIGAVTRAGATVGAMGASL